MNDPSLPPAPITIEDIVRLLLRHFWLLLGCAFAGSAIAAAIAFTMTPVFRAEVLVSVTSDDDRTQALSGLSSQFGGFASLAGLSMGAGGGREVESVATLKSRMLAQTLITEEQLLPVLFADDWDAGQQRWKDPEHAPTPWIGTREFAKLMKVTEDKKTGLVALSVDWKDPALAAHWTEALISRTNRLLRTRSIEHAEKNIAFLQRQLETTSVIEVRQAIYRLLEGEIKSVMLAQGSDEYAFKVIDPVVVPEKKIKPNRMLMVVGGFIAGLVLAIVFVLLARPMKPKTA